MAYNDSNKIDYLNAHNRGHISADTPLHVTMTSGSESTGNITTTPLSSEATYTGTGEQNSEPCVMVYSYADVSGTLYFDWSVDGTNWHAFPTAGYACAAGVPEFHTAVKGGRYFRARYVNGSSAQSTFRLYTYFGSSFLPISSPLNQSIGLDADAVSVRGNDFYDEVARGLRSGVSKFNKFGYNPGIAAASGEVPIWASSATSFTPLTSAETFDIAYDGTGGGSTDGAGTTGATQLTFYYIDSDGLDAIATHTLGTDGTDTTSFSGYGINRCVVSANGGDTFNASNITITATTSGTVQAFIPAEQSVTQQLMFFVASNRTANARWLWMNINKTSGGNPIVNVKGYVYNRGIDTRFEVFRMNIDTAVENTESVGDPLGFTLNPTDVLYFVADTDKDNTVVTGRFSLITYQQ